MARGDRLPLDEHLDEHLDELLDELLDKEIISPAQLFASPLLMEVYSQ